MAKAVFGEFSAYTTPGGVRFQKNNRLTSEREIPAEVASFLRNQLEGTRGEVEPKQTLEPASEPKPATFPRPSDEELARMKAESIAKLQGNPGDDVKTLEAPVEPTEPPLNETDFDAPKDSSGQFPIEGANEPVRVSEPVETPHTPEPGERLPNNVDPNFLETVSIYTADLKDIAQALYDRFGIYTVYLGTLPQNDEINPLTATQFTKYHLGIAYQAAIYAQNQGFLEREPESQKKIIDAGREASANFQVDEVPHTMRENREANSFAYRTSVRGTQTEAATRIEHIRGEDGELHAVQVPVTNSDGEANLNGTNQRYSRDEEELIVEPPIMGGRPIIRPNW